MNERKEYSIQDYGIIGDCETAALVNPDGGIDWLCLPAFDGPSFLGALLDREKGGEFYIRPTVPYQVERKYLDDSAILVTRFRTELGVVELKDFFVVSRKRRARFYDFTSLHSNQKLVRRFRHVEGQEVPMTLAVRARPEYGRAEIRWEKSSDCPTRYISEQAAVTSDLSIQTRGDDLVCHFSLGPGKVHYAVLDYSAQPDLPHLGVVDAWLKVTEAFWREWNLFNYYRGPYEKAIRRSAVTLKLLTYAPTGAFVAAATTSLPENPGGAQNWDYRYVWVRDTSLFIDAFFRLGYSGESRAFFRFLTSKCIEEKERCMQEKPRPDAMIKVLYGIRPKSLTDEKFLDHLSGYRDSKPIRIGNRAADQFQIDNYGQLLQTLYYFQLTGGKMDAHMKSLAEAMVQDVLAHWGEQDNGIWEMPEKKHYTYGKMMAWVAVQRACDMGLLPKENLGEVAQKIRQQVLDQGIKTANGCQYLSESYETSEVDASGLLAFTTGFLPASFATSTREEIERRLAAGPFLYRNQEQKEKLKEGAFLLCSFWRINHWIQEGELKRAEELLKEVMDHASPLGLYAEEIDPATGEFVGNFPQAFSHLGLIATVLNLEDAKKSDRYARMPDHEKFRRIGATIGWKGVLSGFVRAPKTLQLLFSTKSKWKK